MAMKSSYTTHRDTIEQVSAGVIHEVEGRNSSGNQARFFELIEPPLEREQDGQTPVEFDA